MNTPPTTDVKVPLSEDDFGDWQNRIKRCAETLRTRHLSDWRDNASALETRPLGKEPEADLIVVNKDLPRVKQKLSQLFYQVPEVVLKPRREEFAMPAQVFQSVLNFYLSKRIKPDVMIREVLTDVLGVSGIGVAKVGYEFVSEPVEMPLHQLGQSQPGAPMSPGMPPPAAPGMPGASAPPMPGSMPGMPASPSAGAPAVPPVPPEPPAPGGMPGAMPPGMPPSPGASPLDMAGLPPELQQILNPMVTVQRTVWQQYYWNRISPAKFIYPDEFHGSDFDQAPWLAFEFRISKADAKRKYGVSDDDLKESGPDDNLVSRTTTSKEKASGDNGQIKGWEIWYRACEFDETVLNPEKFRLLVILDGVDVPVRHEDSPYQKWDGEKLIAGMRRNPIRVLTLTYISDLAIPPSDVQVSKPQVRELWSSRTQMMQQRKRSLPWRWADKGRLDEETKQAIEDGDVQHIILTDGPGDQVIGEVARANYPSENFEFDRVIEADLAEQWSMGPNSMGNAMPGDTTKAEVETIQSNTGVRLDYERTLVVRFFLSGVEEIAALVQLFADDDDVIEVVGPQGQSQMVSWNRQSVAGEYLFDVKPDSQLRLDAAQDRADVVRLYQMTANDPYVNRYALTQQVIRRHGFDPATIMQQPPPPRPPEPNISYRFSGTDFLTPALPIILQILQQGGVQINPQTVAQVQQAMAASALGGGPVVPSHPGGQPAPPPHGAPHGGPAQQVTPLSKHQLDNNGGL